MISCKKLEIRKRPKLNSKMKKILFPEKDHINFLMKMIMKCLKLFHQRTIRKIITKRRERKEIRKKRKKKRKKRRRRIRNIKMLKKVKVMIKKLIKRVLLRSNNNSLMTSQII